MIARKGTRYILTKCLFLVVRCIMLYYVTFCYIMSVVPALGAWAWCIIHLLSHTICQRSPRTNQVVVGWHCLRTHDEQRQRVAAMLSRSARRDVAGRLRDRGESLTAARRKLLGDLLSLPQLAAAGRLSFSGSLYGQPETCRQHFFAFGYPSGTRGHRAWPRKKKEKKKGSKHRRRR